MKFIVAATPRSGSTWLSNLLTTSYNVCYHDAMAHRTLAQLSDMPSKHSSYGCVETGVLMYPDWFNEQRCKKLVLVRDFDEVNESLTRLGIGAIDKSLLANVYDMNAERISYSDLFNEQIMRGVFEYLLDDEFDEWRYRVLTQMRVNPHFDRTTPDVDTFVRLCKQMEN